MQKGGTCRAGGPGASNSARTRIHSRSFSVCDKRLIIATSSAARAAIFERIRQARHESGARADEAQAVQAYLGAQARGPLPAVEQDLVARFGSRAQGMQATVDTVPAMRDAPHAVATYLRSHQLALSGCVSPQLEPLDWRGAGLHLECGAAHPEDLVGVSGVYAAIAETGTLMLLSSPASPATVSLLPETHIAIVPASRIVAYMEDAWALARSELGEPPRAVNFVSGPSRTADIDQQIVLGAHGPYRVHIVIVLEGSPIAAIRP